MTTMIPPQRKTLTAIADEIRWAAMQADCAADIEPDGAGFYAGEAPSSRAPTARRSSWLAAGRNTESAP